MGLFNNITVYSAMGWLGVLLFLISYYLLIIKKWESTSYAYHIFNLLGGLLLGINCYVDQSYASAFINIIWGFIALYGMYHDQWKKA